MISLRTRRLAIVMALAVVPAGHERSVFAQFPQARLSSLSRPGVRAGETCEVILRGSDLEGASALWFDHGGLSAVHMKDLTFRISAGPDVPLGHHDVRATGTYGVSNPRTIVVGVRPESIEVEPNNAPEKAGAIVVNSVMNGEINGAADIDCFCARGAEGAAAVPRPRGRTDRQPAGRDDPHLDADRDRARREPRREWARPVRGRDAAGRRAVRHQSP